FAGTVLWTAVVLALGTTSPLVALTWSLVPVLTIAGWALLRPERHAVDLAGMHLGLGLLGAIAVATDLELLAAGHEPARMALALPVLVLAAVGVGLVARVRAASRLDGKLDDDSTLGLLGMVISGLVGLLALLAVAVAAAAVGATALGQVGYTLAIAAVALALLVAGLRLRQSTWRHLALAALGCAAIKVVIFDLATAAVVWRALSFVGLGLILIAGALAYSRAKLQASTGAGEVAR
ncbi:MAG: DUF2339 domain-containing protein, partial [Myxococcales bacterium]|nr:DUF2339 domain-containing protein [Myxococcales bacterium]